MHSCHPVIGVLVTAMIWASCSIKEDRSACPCCLTLELADAAIKAPGKQLSIQIFNDEGLVEEKTVSSDLPSLTLWVPKGEISVSANIVEEKWIPSEDGQSLVFLPGTGSDSLYASSRKWECIQEMETYTLLLHKQWCTIHFILDHPEKWEPALFILQSAWSGLTLEGLRPLQKGPWIQTFSCKQGTAQIQVPRQGDDRLILEICRLDENGGNGDLLYSLPLGKMISSTGYDWTQEDLHDITIRLNPAESGFSILITEWNSGGNPTEIII